eukprot:g20292.t1
MVDVNRTLELEDFRRWNRVCHTRKIQDRYQELVKEAQRRKVDVKDIMIEHRFENWAAFADSCDKFPLRSTITCSSPRSPSSAKGMGFSRTPRSPNGRQDMRKTGLKGHSLISRPSTSPTSVIFGDTPPPASAREFGLWRPGKQRLPARIRHEVFLQREMAQLLEKIIDNAHFQDEGNNKEAKEETLKLPHRENWTLG